VNFRVKWPEFKAFVDERGIQVQYLEHQERYFIWAFDGPLCVWCRVRTLTSPENTYKVDFEDNYKANSNDKLQHKSSEGHIINQQGIRTGLKNSQGVTLVSHCFGDKTTWFQKSLQVTDEVLTDSGDGLTFDSANLDWIDINSKRLIYARDEVPDRDGTLRAHSYWGTIVKIDDVVQTSGFTIDFALGKITFTSDQTGNTIKASYSHINGVTDASEFIICPMPNKNLIVEHLEVNFSKSTVWAAGNMRFQTWAGGTDISDYGDFNDTLYLTYGKKSIDYQDFRGMISRGNKGKGEIPTLDGMTGPAIVFPFEYGDVEAKVLRDITKTLIRVLKTDNEPLTSCDLANIAFYMQECPEDML